MYRKVFIVLQPLDLRSKSKWLRLLLETRLPARTNTDLAVGTKGMATKLMKQTTN